MKALADPDRIVGKQNKNNNKDKPNEVKLMDDYEKYEEDCKRIRKENQKLLKEFMVWLKSRNLKDKTINTHIDNVDFYINEFLLYEEAEKAKDGVLNIGMFLGYWFIKKALWSSVAQIKSNAASLKKFYTFLYDKKMIKKEELDELKAIIKSDMPEWIETMKRYDDPRITDPGEIWGI